MTRLGGLWQAAPRAAGLDCVGEGVHPQRVWPVSRTEVWTSPLGKTYVRSIDPVLE